jgi:2-polyprenyl-3-methyl-5-hydroxy-6-metoxy-1,4-benzoquinol methylase
MTAESAVRYDRLARAAGGLGSSHQWLLERIPVGASVLDCGCAGGFFARAAIESRNAVVDGVEIDAEAARGAAGICRRIFVGSLDDPEFLRSLSGDLYDRVLFGDVLEHLARPELALSRAAELLAPGGRILVAVPNVAYWGIRLDLLRGRFDYTDSGLMDRTHLRFFTYHSVRELVRAAGCRVVEQDLTVRMSVPGLLGGLLRGLVRRLPNLFAYQTLLELEKCRE